MPVVSKREAARRDLVEHFVYLAENAGLDVADRFLTNAESSFADLRAAWVGTPVRYFEKPRHQTGSFMNIGELMWTAYFSSR